ncbi:MAG: hypothetical protein FJX46_11000, partial [Alphaproteobacteria bacterium]|nr:hypothetical protein [Alphaproteobacteria bacterium]
MSLGEARAVAERLDAAEAPDSALDLDELGGGAGIGASERNRAMAEAAPPPGADAETLARFLTTRGVARRAVGRYGDSVADLRQARELALKTKTLDVSLIAHELYNSLDRTGRFGETLVAAQEFFDTVPAGDQERVANYARQYSRVMALAGRLKEAEIGVKRAETAAATLAARRGRGASAPRAQI